MVEKAREQFSLSNVVFVPCNQSPFKGSTHATGEQRIRMLDLAIAEQEWDWATTSGVELVRAGPSFSWMTAEYFSRENPDAELHWILGTDQWEVIEKWACPETLRDLLKFIVVTRDGSEVTERNDWRLVKMEFDHSASSTAVRTDLKANSNFLTKAVLCFCEENELYKKG